MGIAVRPSTKRIRICPACRADASTAVVDLWDYYPEGDEPDYETYSSCSD